MSTKPRVLLTNDDGPPGPHSPYIFGLYRHLVKDLGWDVKVVVPSSQKSWIGKAYQITEVTRGRYYYPTDPEGQGEISEKSRPLRDNELGEWILLDGTPATCSNIALHNLYKGEIDLVISGPNLGRNTSSAFSLSSGTIGAALSSSLSRTRSIALSYGTMHARPQATWFDPAHAQAMRIIAHLYDNWGSDPYGLRAGEIDMYSINIPMVEELLGDAALPVCWTNFWRTNYGRLFKAHAQGTPADAPSAGPDAPSKQEPPTSGAASVDAGDVGQLLFKWSPDMTELIAPTSIPVGSDAWAISKGYVSVTPLRASFAEPDRVELSEEVRFWKVKL